MTAAQADHVGARAHDEAASSADADTTTAAKTILTTQKAWRVTGRGTPAQVLILTDAPVPTLLRNGDVLLKVQAAALNPV